MYNFNILPTEITWDIFTRVPAESVLSCKGLSKTWRNLIQHPSFSKMHLNRLNHYVDTGKLGFLTLAWDKNFYNFEYNENLEIPIDKITRIKLTSPYQHNILIGSFNGLICLHEWHGRFCILNPVTKEYVTLHEPKKKLVDEKRWVGFGHLPSTNEYKVVQMYEPYRKANFLEVMVYSIGTGSGWRNIGKFNIKTNNHNFVTGIFENEALHWIDGERWVQAFDLADENFRERLIRLPPYMPKCICDKFGVLGGFLFFAHRYFCSVTRQYLYDIWIYKKKTDYYDLIEQDEHQPLEWNKEVTAAYGIPLAFTESGDLLSYGPGYLHIYDKKALTSKRLQVEIKEEFRQLFPHKKTLVSLKELGEEDTKIMGPVKIKKRKGRD